MPRVTTNFIRGRQATTSFFSLEEHTIVAVGFYAGENWTISPGERPFSRVVQNKCHSSMALCWPFVCDGAGAHGTAAEELRHSECSAKRRNQKTAGSTRTSKKGASGACA